jgi:hypothetical protein
MRLKVIGGEEMEDGMTGLQFPPDKAPPADKED